MVAGPVGCPTPAESPAGPGAAPPGIQGQRSPDWGLPTEAPLRGQGKGQAARADVRGGEGPAGCSPPWTPSHGTALNLTARFTDKETEAQRSRDLPQVTQHRPTLQRPHPPPSAHAPSQGLGAGRCRYYSHFGKDSRLYS